MQTSLKSLPKSEIQITVQLTPDEYAQYEKKAAARVSEQVEIPGFRKGQAPKAFVLAKIGADAYEREVAAVVVDVGARAEIYGLMNRLTAEGLAILMISSELPEVLGMADRIVVLREGRTMGELARAAATPERVMGLATRT